MARRGRRPAIVASGSKWPRPPMNMNRPARDNHIVSFAFWLTILEALAHPIRRGSWSASPTAPDREGRHPGFGV